LYAVLQFYCKYRLPGCARRPQHREWQPMQLVTLHPGHATILPWAACLLTLPSQSSQLQEMRYKSKLSDFN